jgi:hypothetical protein
MRRLLLAFALSAAMVGAASARSEKTLAYLRDQAWPAAVRFLRVDAKLKLIEKDAEAGYVLFEYREENKTFRGSLEVIEVVKDGRKLVRFVVQIEDRPAWVEVELLTKLERKLRAELGTPAPSPSPRPPRQDEPRPEPDKPADKPDKPPTDDGPPISDKP